VATITVNRIVGRSSGTVIVQNCRHGEAPSIAADSYSASGIACMAAR
jgi:hypothetical protein